MKRFMRSAGASSSSSAERPANVLARSSGVGESAIPSSSAEQPATSSDLKIICIRDVQRWLASEAIARYSTADLESIREAAAALSTPKPRQEDVRPFIKKWQLGPCRDKTHYEMVQEFQRKVIKAAQKLQQQLRDSVAQSASSTVQQPVRMEEASRQQTASSSAEQPASSDVEQSARMDTTDGVDSDDNPMVIRLQARQRKRGLDSAAENQRPLAKPKATRGRNKRTVATSSDSVEQPASKRKERLLTSELFALGACDPSDSSAAQFDSAVFPATVRQQGRNMCRLLEELRKLSSCAWIVGDADVRCKAIMRNALDLQKIPATQRMLLKRSISVLYSSICGKLHPGKGLPRQDYTHVSFTASMVVERQARHFLQARDEIEESNMDQYPCLWELKNREHDAVLNGLHEMPRSPHELFEILNDVEASASAPFGRLPPLGHAGPPFLKAGLPLMEAFHRNSACPWAQPGTCNAASRVMRCLRMMLSHRLPSSFNMSTRRTMCIEQYVFIVNT